MYQVKIRKPFAQIGEGYHGKVAPFSPDYASSFLEYVLRRSIASQVRGMGAKLHFGELEKLVLSPLFAQAQKILVEPTAFRDIADMMISRGMAYTIIDQLMQVYEIREVSKYVSDSMLERSELYRAIKTLDLNAVGKDGTSKAEKVKALLKSGDESDHASTTQLALSTLRNWISGTISNSKDEEATRLISSLGTDISSILKVLSQEMFSPGVYQATTGSIASIYNEFIATAKSGKGPVLSFEQRAPIVTMITTVQAAVSKLLQYARSVSDEGERLPVAAAACQLAMGLLQYLKMAKDPDMYFPHQDLEFNVMAWASGLKMECGQLKDFWVSLAIGPATYNIALANILWREEVQWMNFLGEPFTVLKEATAQLDEALNNFSSVKVAIYEELAKATIDYAKAVTGSEQLLPANFYRSFIIDEAVDQMASLLVANKTNSLFTSAKAAIELDAPSAPVDVSPDAKRAQSEDMALEANSITVAAQVVQRSIYIAAAKLDEPTPIQSFVTISAEDLKFPATKDASEWLGFRPVSRLSLAVPRYAGQKPTQAQLIAGSRTPFSPEWTWKPFLYKIYYPNMAVVETAANLEPLLMWSEDAPVAIGVDALTRAWGVQRIPAVYTYSRNRSIAPYTMVEYLRGMTDRADGLQGKEYLEHVARLIGRYGEGDAIVKTIVAYLSPVMRVFIVSGGEPHVLMPELATVYSVPTKEFFGQQKGAELNAKAGVGELTFRYQISDSKGSTDNYVLFQLHDQYPKPVESLQILQTLESGQVVPVSFPFDYVLTVMKERWRDITPEQAPLLEILTNAWDKGAVSWTGPLGWSPLFTWMPGVYAEAYERAEVSDKEALIRSSMLAIKWKENPLTKGLMVRVFVENPCVLLDDEDREKAASMEDPTLSPTEGRAPESPVEIPAPGNEKGPSPDSIAPRTTDDAGKGADVAKVPVLAQNKEGDQIVVVDPVKSALQGDPANSGGAQAPAPEEEMVWVKIVEGDSTVLKKVKKSAVPEGAVLASDDEIKAWLANESK
jgi:hypothetical protein